MRTQQNSSKNVQQNNNAVVQAVAAQQAPVVAPQQPAGLLAPMQQALTVPVVTVVQPTSLRAARVAAVQVALLQRYRAAKVAKHTAAVATWQQSNYLAAVQALAIAHGQPVPTTLSARALVTPQQHAPSAISGPCATVRAFVHANPLLTRKQVQQHFTGTNYINPATVSTQYQLAKGGKA